MAALSLGTDALSSQMRREQAGFLRRERTRTGAAILISSGIVEEMFGRYVRNVRLAIAATAQADATTGQAPTFA